MIVAGRALMVAIAVALVIPAGAQTQTSVVIPDTPLGKLAGSLIAAINTGDKQKIKGIINDKI
jgi:hypothetical protein